MASPAADIGQSHQHHPASDSAADSAFQEAQTWIEAVTGRCFGDRDFRGGLENGILLCELLSSIKPGLVKKINRLPTPIAGLDNLSVFLRGCEELGLKGSQLFDPGDLQDTSTRPIAKGSDCSRKLKNVLITIYWLGRAANGCTSYNGPTLDLKEFEGLLSQMRKEAEEAESPKRSIRDSGYIDCWDSERSDSLSPPRHGREDSFDSLDSFGSRSRQTPSPDVLVARGSSDGRGSDSESDGTPHRKVPDIRKDDMSARRTSVSELRTAMPFNQYLPNKSNQSGYVPTPLRKKKNDKEEGARKSWSTATSPIGGDRPFSPDEIRSLDTPSPSSPPPLEPQTQIHREDEGPRTVSIPSIEIHAANRRRSSDPPPCSVPQPHAEPHADTVTHLMGASAQSTPARSCSEELFHLSTTLAGNTVVASVVATGPGKHSPATDREEAGVSKGPAGAPLACQTLTSLKRTPSPSHLLPVPAATATTSKEIANTGRRKGRALSESDDPQGSWFDGNLPATFSHTDIVSDDSQSVSMIDMRGEDEGILQPHSQVRHELMHNQYNMMKEEEDHWQDDLARWKNRRRSVSQDLIKKEEERKMMENLLTGDVCPAQRRRSIKTYREIVEEKERREEDLRDTYRRARTPEEASVILQRYAQRFSISETILERLQLPQLLDRSISADPSFACSPFPLSLSSSPTTPDPFDVDPNGPLRFLRQQSAPAPKFTSTLEARIEEFPKDLSSPHQRPQIRSRSSEPPSTRALSPKPVPLLTPKPYFESRGRAAEPWANKADGLLRVNGNAGSDAPTAPESRGTESPPHFQASPSRTSHSTVAAPCSAASPAHSPHASPAGGSPASIKAKEARGGTRAASEDVREQRGAEHSSPLSRPTSLPAELQKSEESFWKTGDQTAAGPEEKTSNAAAQPTTRTEAKQEVKPEASGPNVATLVQSGLSTQQCHTVTLQASFPSSQEFSQGGENVPNLTAPGSSGYHPAQELTAEFANSVISPPATSNPKLRWEFFAPPEAPEKDLRGNVSVPVLPQARRADRWSWDPDEERKRQERWQQEQERMLQEKYRREQEKLKEEWEKAQREVAEEERKYHEEERRILEETAAPLTPRSSALPSPSRGELSSTAEPHDTIVRSLADWERKQELLERQSRGSTESAEGKRRENDRTSDISTADDSMKTGRSLVSHSSSQPETLGHSLQNGQKPPATLKPSTPVKKQEDLTTDGNKAGQSAGDRRGGPIDNNTSRSSSKPPAACPPPPDTLPPAPNRSVSGKKLCSSCGQPLGKGAAMIIETLSLYFHIHCFKCGVCKGQLGDTTTGTDVRIRNGLLNCHQCYIRSRSAGQPTTL
ncbi:LIM and calponin homology domains-containing protein 1-like isoform X2 [Hippoglossus hippoglossus]|uniref:LIM and calponin homology domains-containing protein 1-like isoform X1 n=2 Tax=Hippoglossus hippoglossus TaxID=8267 RepID=UPI00148E3306|nr:LIM and calponin homology domains-containing protein 1-like isoform X1 [Hippoglossus hippoglossus]XP_034453672.1 LIM and calponin homology domains-containing protein 1-like isoform X2 [Hippoglossus hippoglossus]